MSEKRKEKRVARRMKVKIIAGNEKFPGVIENISRHGLKIRTPFQPEPGKKIAILLDEENVLPIQLKGSVRWQRTLAQEILATVREMGVLLENPPLEFLEFLFVYQGKRIIDFLEDLPAMPVIILDLMALLNDPATTAREVEIRIKTDQVLVAYLLKIVNSALYGFHQKITSIKKTITLMGYNALKATLLTYFSRQLNRLLADKTLQKQLWNHALTSALIAREAARICLIPEEEAHIAGLLHDVGKPVLFLCDHKLYLEVVEQNRKLGRDFQEAENEAFGFSHVEMGLYLMEKWKLPAILHDPLRFHHQAQEYSGSNPLVPLVAWVNQMAHHFLEKRPAEPPAPFGQLHLTADDTNTILQRIKDEVKLFT